MNVLTMPRHLVHLASACCDGCNNISEILERLQQSGTDATSLSQNGSWCRVYPRVLCVSHVRFCVIGDSALSFFPEYPLDSSGPALASPTSLCFMMCDTPHWLKCLHERIMSSAWSSTLCGCPFFDLLFFALFLSVCFSHLFFYLDTDLYLFLHVVDIRTTNHWHSAN